METIDEKYWIIQDGLRKGPYTLSEIERMYLPSSTPVWRKGLENWVSIQDLPEFKGKFTDDGYRIPPNPPQPKPYDHPMPPTYMVWSIITMLLCCLIPGIVALVYSSKVSSRYVAGDYIGAKRASDRAATWIIITVICGLIVIPFQTIWMLV